VPMLPHNTDDDSDSLSDDPYDDPYGMEEEATAASLREPRCPARHPDYYALPYAYPNGLEDPNEFDDNAEDDVYISCVQSSAKDSVER
jgi:hypothetical protein